MHFRDHALIGKANTIPVPTAKAVLSYSPVVLPVANRALPLEVRVTTPAEGTALPIVLLSNGMGRSNWLSSLEGFAPLAEFWASRGFAVLQPTPLSATINGLKAPVGQELFWQDRAADMERILDHLGVIESTVPCLAGRLDSTRVAIVGHSAGSFAAMLLMGVKQTDPRDGSTWHGPETRIKTGIILGGLGNGADIHEEGRKRLPQYGPDFDTMTCPALVVCGDKDVSTYFTERGADWHADAYTLAPAPKDLLMLKGAWHCLGGISGWDAAENSHELGDESPETLGIVQRMTWAYLWSQLYPGDLAWEKACNAIRNMPEHGTVEAK